MQIKLRMIKNFKDIHNSEADLWTFGKKPPGKKFAGKLSPRIMSPQSFPLRKSLIDIKHLFAIVNNNLVNIKDWFTANKLSLNVEKQNTHSSIRQARKMMSLFAYRILQSITMKYKDKNLSLGFY